MKRDYVESLICLLSAQVEVTGGQTRGRDCTKKVDTRAVSVKGLSGSVAREEKQPRPEFRGLFK